MKDIKSKKTLIFTKKECFSNKKLDFFVNIRESLINASNRHVTPLIPFPFLTTIPRGRHVSKKARRKNLPL